MRFTGNTDDDRHIEIAIPLVQAVTIGTRSGARVQL